MAFTPEQKALCLEMIKAGHNCMEVQEATGFTVGQVCGFAKRAGLVMRDIQAKRGNGAGLPRPPAPTPIRLEHRARVLIEPVPIRKKHVPPKEPIETRVGSDKPVTIMELNSNHCRWMVDDTHYCGALTVIKGNKLYRYCATHFKITYRPPVKRDE
jgi:hypothetical protein